jgi:deoxyribose-phosphate aldolase
MPITRAEVAALIDHTILRPDVTESDVREFFAEARREVFAAVCVAPTFVEAAASEMAGSGVKVCTVIGFPSGAHDSDVKAFEARRAIRDGADELDVVMAIGRLKGREHAKVREDLAGVVRAAEGRPVKAILEICYLDDEEVRQACEIALEARVAFVKTSTGFGPGGATHEAVRLMRSVVLDRAGVKAAGGIRDTSTALGMIECGATRLGTSASLAILDGLPGQEDA